MDIQISSNFERLLFDLYEKDAPRIAQMMQEFRATQSITLTPAAHSAFAKLFLAHRVSDEETLETMRLMQQHCGYVPDPHTAVGLAAAKAVAAACGEAPIITLATAHPAKFPDAARDAGLAEPQLPAHLADLYERAERTTQLANDYTALRATIEGL